MTMTALFQRVERAQHNGRCASMGTTYECLCQSFSTYRVTYDPALGYPTQLTTTPTWRDNLAHPDYWRYLWSRWKRASCSATSDDLTRSVTVHTLTPLR
jgi:hypothetical protein